MKSLQSCKLQALATFHLTGQNAGHLLVFFIKNNSLDLGHRPEPRLSRPYRPIIPIVM